METRMKKTKTDKFGLLNLFSKKKGGKYTFTDLVIFLKSYLVLSDSKLEVVINNQNAINDNMSKVLSELEKLNKNKTVVEHIDDPAPDRVPTSLYPQKRDDRIKAKRKIKAIF